MQIFTFLVAAVTCSVCHASICCFPEQWEGSTSILTQNLSGLFSQIYVDMSVDMVGQRIRQYDKTSGTLQLYFFKQGVGYMIENSTCSKGEVSPWPKNTFCIPDGAKVLQKYNIGGNKDMNVTDYMFSSDVEQVMQQTVRTVTNKCIPVEDKTIRQDSNESQMKDAFMYTLTYENITPGIKNAHVFDVPSICKSSARKVEESQNAKKYHSTNHMLNSSFLVL